VTSSRRLRFVRTAIAAGAGACVTAGVSARPPSALERRLFVRLNRGGEWPVLRAPQQLGTPWMLPSLAVYGFVTHRPELAVSAALALPLEKATELTLRGLTGRPRPARLLSGTELHDDAPVDGAAFPSGHAAIATCAAMLLAPYLPRWVRPVPALMAAATTYTRVHQGAHYPTDGLGGVLQGLALASLLQAAFPFGGLRTPRSPTRERAGLRRLSVMPALLLGVRTRT
jgi:membrane-associated phospholipid phosphatase